MHTTTTTINKQRKSFPTRWHWLDGSNDAIISYHELCLMNLMICSCLILWTETNSNRFGLWSLCFVLNLIQNDMENGKEYVNNFPCIAAPIIYSPPMVTSIASIVGVIGGSKSQLRRSTSSVVSKSCTSDDELNELKSPLLSSIFLSGNSSSSAAVSTKSSLRSREIFNNESPFRYELLRDVWMSKE